MNPRVGCSWADAVAAAPLSIGDVAMHDPDAVVTHDGLLTDYGIKISRTHARRREGLGTFPARFPPFGGPKSRFYYWRHEIVAWLKGLWKPAPTAPKK